LGHPSRDGENLHAWKMDLEGKNSMESEIG
jgi:hypothetical protein